MGAKNHTLLLRSIGKEVISHPQSLARQIRQSVGRRSTRRQPLSDILHRVPVTSSEPTNRGPGTNANSSTTETSSSAVLSDHEQPAFRTGSARVITRDARPPSSNVNLRAVTRILLYAAENDGNVFIKDMRKFARACHRYLGSRAQVDDRVVMGDIGFEFGMFLNQTSVRVEDMFIFGVSGHGRIWNNLVTFCLSADKSISFQDIFKHIHCLPFYCTIEMFLDVCLATMAAEQHSLYKIWPSDELLSSFNQRDNAARPRVGPKIILWAASGKQGAAYFRPGKNSYMLAATCKTLEEHASNITRRELYKKITERLERRLNRTLRRRDTAPQIPAIFSSVPDRDLVLGGYALQPLLSGDEQETV